MEDYKKRTVASYDENAQRFAQKFHRLAVVNERWEFARFKQLIKGDRVLDLGCGAGDHAAYFQEQGLDVVCVDLSEQMIRLCREKDLDARQMDIENLRFADASFDGIWAVTSLLHIKKRRLPAVARDLHRILADKGVLYVCVKQGLGQRMVEDDDGHERFFAYYQPEELLRVFEAGFQVLEQRTTQLGTTTFLQVFLRKR